MLKEAHLTPEDPIIQLFDVQPNRKKIYIGRLWEIPTGLWRWESYYGDSKNDEPNKEAAISMLVQVAISANLSVEDAV